MDAQRAQAYRIAREFLAPYVRRGDSLESLMAGHQGWYWEGTHVSLGGYLIPGDRKTLQAPDKVLVLSIAGVPMQEVFHLRILYKDLANAHPQLTLW